MKKMFLVGMLFIIPLLYAEHADIAPSAVPQRAITNIEDSPLDLAPARPLPASSGRALGDTLLTIDALALGIDGPSGLSWDGQYLYVVSLLNDSVYVVDPFVPTVINRWATPTVAAAPFGCGLEQNLWVTTLTPDSAYEYTTSGTATGNAFLAAPSGALYCADGGEWWPSGEIWLIGVGSACGNQAFKFSVPDGAVLDSIGDPLWTGSSQRGISYDPYADKFWLGGWNSDSVWELNLDGSPTGRSFYMDGCAGIAYDWQSTYHPTPVLWICRQGADQIVMVDADNPNPGPSGITFDFEDGWQGWIHTNADTFPFAWDVQPSGLHASWTPPDAGDSCMWIDSDAAGVGPIVEDTAWSPVLVPNATMDWLKYGLGYNNLTATSDSLYVGIMTYSSGVWNPPIELLRYSADYGPAYDSLDVSSYSTAERIRIYFYYSGSYDWYAAFDNVSIDATIFSADHDVGCTEVVSPPEGSCVAADYDVIGRIQNFGNNTETFDAMAVVYDTVGMTQVFSQSVTLTDFPVAGDSNVNFGTVTFNADSYYYTMIYTMLSGDSDPSNDTSAVYSTTAISFGDVVYELDAQAVVADNQLLGIEFDGERFYITGGNNGVDPNKVYVVDTAGTLLWSLDQPSHSTGWGWRDVAWDDVYVGPDRIDTLYASVNTNVDYFSIDLTGGVLTYHGFSPGAQNPNRALAYKPDSGWFYTANFSSSCYKFDKSGVIVQSVPNTLAHYGAAYDGDTTGGPYVWWHSQDNPGTGFLCQITQMDAQTMTFTGLITGFALPAALTDATAGGLCFYSGFNDMDVLFALLQGTPNDYIVGIYVRPTPGTGIEGKPGDAQPLAFGFAPTLTTVSRGRMPIAYSTTVPGHVSLKVYDGMGRLVQTLVNVQQPAGEKSVYWDNKDVNQRTVSNGVYFLKLEADNQTAVHKLILVR